nr:MAG TPA: hypothetical protein [Caudoviricetes sp.]
MPLIYSAIILHNVLFVKHKMQIFLISKNSRTKGNAAKTSRIPILSNPR